VAYKIFKEKNVRRAIIKKVDPEVKSKNAKHWTAKIHVNGMYLTTVKISNNHNKDFGMGKAKNVAKQLLISQSQYNELISCTLSGKEYFKLQEKKLIPPKKEENSSEEEFPSTTESDSKDKS